MFPSRLENMVEEHKLELQKEWNEKREYALKHLRRVREIEEAYVEGLFVEDGWNKIPEDCYDTQSIDDYEYELEHRVETSAGGLFGQPSKLITERFVDRVAELFYEKPRSKWEYHYGEVYANRKMLGILESMGFYIPEKIKDCKKIGYYAQNAWITMLGKHFEEFLKKQHPELHKYWEFAKTVYMLADINNQ